MTTKKELQQQIQRLRQELKDMEASSRSVLGRNIIRIRKQRGLTQEDLAEALGKQRPTLSNIERGANNTSLGTLAKMCDVLKVTPNDLLLEKK